MILNSDIPPEIDKQHPVSASEVQSCPTTAQGCNHDVDAGFGLELFDGCCTLVDTAVACELAVSPPFDGADFANDADHGHELGVDAVEMLVIILIAEVFKAG